MNLLQGRLEKISASFAEISARAHAEGMRAGDFGILVVQLPPREDWSDPLVVDVISVIQAQTVRSPVITQDEPGGPVTSLYATAAMPMDKLRSFFQWICDDDVQGFDSIAQDAAQVQGMVVVGVSGLPAATCVICAVFMSSRGAMA